MTKTLLTFFALLPLLINTQKIVDKSNENKVFEKVETEAGFPGGPALWKDFVKNNFNFSRVEKGLADSITSFSDTSIIEFVIDRNGMNSNIFFQNVVSKNFKESCIQLFKESPHCQPGMHCGRNVSAYKIQSIIVQIDKSTGKKLILIRVYT